MSQRILIVDDDRQLVRLLRAYLEDAGYTAPSAHDGEAALRALRTERPSLVLLDIMLPELDGWEVLRRMRGDASLAPIPVIMLTARVEDHDKIVGLELGADDYITKPFNPREVLARIKAVLRRLNREPATPRLIQHGPLSFDLDRRLIQAGGHTLALTPTEFSLFSMLAQYPGRPFTRLELIEKGLGYSYEGLERTVDSHIKNLRRKLADVGVDPDFIETVFGVGYRLREVPAERAERRP